MPSGRSSSAIRDVDQARNYQTILMIGVSGAAFLLFFGVNAVLKANYLLAGVLFVGTLLGMFSIILMRKTGNDAYGSNGISLTVGLIFIYLVASGGVENTGPLWCHPLFLIIMLLQGFRRGLMAFSGLLGITAILLFYPDLPMVTGEYSRVFRVRFIGSFAALGIMASIYEYLRWRSQNDYVAISHELELASRTDALTGLANRRAFQARLETELNLYSRHGHPFSIIMIDLDYFKQMNDRYGHSKGDELLILVARLLLQEVRQQDLVCRWGGEEFLVLLSHTNQEQALIVAEKLRAAIAAVDLNVIGIASSMTASFGVSSISDSRNISELISEADRKLYAAKRSGRNQVSGATG